MAFQIIPETSFASSLGSNLGQGLGQGLQQLLSQRQKEKLLEKQIPGLQKILPGSSKEELQSLLQLDPSLLKEYLKGQRTSREGEDIADILANYDNPQMQSGFSGGEQQDFEPQRSLQQQLQKPKFSTFDAINAIKEAQLGSLQSMVTPKGAESKSLSPYAKEEMETPVKPTSFNPSPFEHNIAQEEKELKKYKTETEKLNDYLKAKGKNISQASRLQLERLITDRQKNSDDREAKVRKYNQKGFEQIRNDYVAATRDEAIYDQIIDIASNPEWLRDPAVYRVGKTLQLSGALAHVGLEELSHIGETVPQEILNKLTAELAQGAASVYGGRLNQKEFETYQQSILSAMTSPEGMIALAKNGKLRAQAKKMKFKKSRELENRYRDRLPYDVLDQVDEELEPKLQRLKQEELKNIQNSIKSQGDLGKKKSKWFQFEKPLINL